MNYICQDGVKEDLKVSLASCVVFTCSFRIIQCNLQLKSLLYETCMIILGHSVTYTAVSMLKLDYTKFYSLLFRFVVVVVRLFMIHLAISLMFIPLVLSYCVGQPKRHLLTTGWSMFVGAKRLRAGDSVLFIRYCKNIVMKVAAS